MKKIINKKEWQKIHPKYKYAAMDDDGSVFVFVKKPQKHFLGFWFVTCEIEFEHYKCIDEINFDWEKTLTCRY